MKWVATVKVDYIKRCSGPLIQIKGRGTRPGDHWFFILEQTMPPETKLVLIAIIIPFVVFMGTMMSVDVWSRRPEKE